MGEHFMVPEEVVVVLAVHLYAVIHLFQQM
jgi:hypothetical protein